MRKFTRIPGLIIMLFTWAGTCAQYSKLLDFDGANNGGYPTSDLLFYNSHLYGMAGGGANNMGVIFKIEPGGTGYTKLLDFNGTGNGKNPAFGPLITDGEYLYGSTIYGGVNDRGVIFKIKFDGSGYQKLLDFDGITKGQYPISSLVGDGTYLYGMTYQGGTNNAGVIYKIKTDGSGYAKLLDFSTGNGQAPRGALISDGNYLYGTTTEGGVNSLGVVFKIKTDGSGYQKLLDFDGTGNGGGPDRSLFMSNDFLYGTTYEGGANDNGVIFRIKPDGTSYQKLFDFSGSNGQYPRSTLTGNGTYLFGMTSAGGANNFGVVFKIKSDGSNYGKLLDFDGANGLSGIGSLTINDTYLYGMTNYGGSNNKGVVFKFAIPAALPLKLLNFKVRENNCTAVIQWTTEEETGVSHFDLEKSSNGVRFTLAARLNAKNTISKNTYNTSAGIEAPNMYYRLKMVDLDGATTYSNIVHLSTSCTQQKVLVYPNPVKDVLFITKANPGSVYNIYNNAGELVVKSIIRKIKENINTKQLQAGIYYMRITNSDGNMQFVKFLKE